MREDHTDTLGEQCHRWVTLAVAEDKHGHTWRWRGLIGPLGGYTECEGGHGTHGSDSAHRHRMGDKITAGDQGEKSSRTNEPGFQ